jgi:hypothetical protein
MRVKTMIAAVVALVWVGPAAAQPLVREAAGATPAAIQAAVDAFRTDLGGVNNGNAAGSQSGGRREINWDGGGAAATPTLDPSPMTRFSNRGAVFTTPGHGFEISGAPSPNFGEINPVYGTHFAAFSSPRLFSALGSSVLDAWFFVPGSTTVAAGVPGFGAVFTGVSAASSTRLEFYAADGALLYEHAVPPAAGNGTLSFVGVSFPYGEIVARVRIVSGNTALGPADAGAIDAVAMDDFVYGEPVAVQGLSITPQTGRLFRTATLDLIVGVSGLTGTTVTGGRVQLDGYDVTAGFVACLIPGSQAAGQTFRCPVPRGAVATGDHVLNVELNLSNGTRLRNAVRWTVIANTEP